MSRAEERVSEVLKMLVEQYIQEGQPIASKAIAQRLTTPASSATVRNVMALLEEQGLIESPHTSAGRVPTPLGYRVFVDQLITLTPLEMHKLDRARVALDPTKTPQELVEAASKVLSEFTAMAGIVLAPRQTKAVLRHVEFLPLQGRRALVILVFNEQEVQNRIIQLDRDYSQSELQQAANLFNTQFAGQGLQQVRERLLSDMKRDKAQMDHLTDTAISVASQALQDADQPAADYVVSGQANLIKSLGEEAGIERLTHLFQAFQQKQELLQLMDRCVKAEGLQIFIGQESGYQLLDGCSLITSPYRSNDNQLLGVLAVVGPTRMPYQEVIPMVQMTAKILSSALNSEEQPQ